MDAPTTPPAADAGTPAQKTPRSVPAVQPPRRRAAQSTAELPSYSQSLLQVRVPLIVTLASKKQSVSEILNLGPGAIIQFNKSCDQMLDIEVGQRCVAQGEAVKVGEKFGIRVTSMVLPDGDFVAISKRQAAT
ncbi:MAG: FliM/FliN family flagellar motor switch protein [Pirellulales bacterium]